MFRRVLAVTLGCLMHFSLCTGGSFAVVSAAVSHLASQETAYTPVSMSYAGVGYLSCARSKPTEKGMTSGSGNGCSDASSCLTREFTRKRDLTAFAADPVTVALPVPDTPAYLPDFAVLSRPSSGVLFASAVHPGLSSIVKTE